MQFFPISYKIFKAGRTVIRRRLFIVLSLAIALSDIIFIGLNYRSATRTLDQEWESAWERANSTLELALHEQAQTMLLLASNYAADPEIQQLFLQGKRAVAQEGGGKGGPKANDFKISGAATAFPSWAGLCEFLAGA